MHAAKSTTASANEAGLQANLLLAVENLIKAQFIAKQIFLHLLARRLRHLAPKLDVARYPEARHLLIAICPKFFGGQLGIAFQNHDSLYVILAELRRHRDDSRLQHSGMTVENRFDL